MQIVFCGVAMLSSVVVVVALVEEDVMVTMMRGERGEPKCKLILLGGGVLSA